MRLRPSRHTGSVSGMRGRAGESDGRIVRRRIFNAIAVVSAVLCVETRALWVRSYWVADSIIYVHGQTSAPNAPAAGKRNWVAGWSVGSRKGGMSFMHSLNDSSLKSFRFQAGWRYQSGP